MREFKIEITIPEAVINANAGEDIYDYIRDQIAGLIPEGEEADVGEIEIDGHWHTR
jgi:hypothetical protein